VRVVGVLFEGERKVASLALYCFDLRVELQPRSTKNTGEPIKSRLSNDRPHLCPYHDRVQAECNEISALTVDSHGLINRKKKTSHNDTYEFTQMSAFLSATGSKAVTIDSLLYLSVPTDDLD
jgi:hypothetical protein